MVICAPEGLLHITNGGFVVQKAASRSHLTWLLGLLRFLLPMCDSIPVGSMGKAPGEHETHAGGFHFEEGVNFFFNQHSAAMWIHT